MNYQETVCAQAPQAAKIAPATQVRAELDKLDENMATVFVKFETLVDRLAPVLTPRGSGSSEKQATPAPVRCDLADELHRRNDALSAFRERIDNLLMSLEI